MICSVFIATSLDGFIARENGTIDWLPIPVDGGEDYGYKAFMDTVDALVMGRHTFETALSFDAWPYEKPVVVLSSRPVTIPLALKSSVSTFAGSPATVIAEMERRGARHLYVDGGVTIQRFLEAAVISRMIITRVPVLLGRGIPLFGPASRDMTLQHVATRSFPNGLVQSEYRIAT